jgi:recombinational DNA repair ATPase RecF
VALGGPRPVVIAGPCAVESREQIRACARVVKEMGGGMLRGGCFKPRTSPYSFQGLGYEALDLLAEAGAEVIAARARLCSRLLAPLERRLAELGGDPQAPPLRYLPNREGDAGALRRELAGRRGRDVERAVTSIGPHLDDFAIADAGKDLRHFGSQGEQRRALLGLILAESDLLAEERGERPLLLLDDVTSELDLERRSRLLDAVSEFDQAIATTPDEADLAGRAGSLLRVSAGTVRA